MSSNQELNDFLSLHSSYSGHFTPENLAFNANLQEFAQKISFICNLETAGKIESEDAYKRIKALWKVLKISKAELGIESNPLDTQ
jgi:hypothetical protein